MSSESVSYRATCDRGCPGMAWWTGRVADNGGGTPYRVWGCSRCGPPTSAPVPVRPARPRLWRRTA